MRIKQIGKIVSVALLLSVFLYSTAIRELHYAFSESHHIEQMDHKCDHHIHSTHDKGECQICKIDVNHLYTAASGVYSHTIVFLPKHIPITTSEVVFITRTTRYLRGPPAQA